VLFRIGLSLSTTNDATKKHPIEENRFVAGLKPRLFLDAIFGTTEVVP